MHAVEVAVGAGKTSVGRKTGEGSGAGREIRVKNRERGAEDERADPDSDSRTEHRVREDCAAIDANQDCAVTNPGSPHP